MSKRPQTSEALLDRLEWTVIRRLDGLLQGQYRTLFRGSGVDFADLREYELHDDVRSIDWNVTARLDTPYVREYTEEREITAWFLCDLTPSLDFGSVKEAKRRVLIEFAAVIARILTRGGNRVGAILYHGDRISMLPSRSGRQFVLRIIHELENQPTYDRSPPTDLGEFLDAARGIIRRRSLVFLLSDFHSVAGWEAPLGALAMNHEVLAVRIFDPFEVKLPDIGIVPMYDAESGAQVDVDTGSRQFRRRYAEVASENAAQVRDSLANAAVDGIELSTEDDLVTTIVDYIRLKNHRAMYGEAMR